MKLISAAQRREIDALVEAAEEGDEKRPDSAQPTQRKSSRNDGSSPRKPRRSSSSSKTETPTAAKPGVERKPSKSHPPAQGMVRTSFDLPRPLHVRLKMFATISGRPMKDLALEVLDKNIPDLEDILKG